ncbi:MAG: response regulator transcription factor [Lachnospiraceae bacterium]|nr:response regulator transcription factor [Lachnospiraceae bacterium]
MDRIRILVADDEERMRKLIRDFLKVRDIEVLEAENGEEAVDIFLNNKDISLIIMDVMMPKMDGFRAVKEIRMYSNVPVMMLTAKSEEKDELMGFNIGVDEYITKPFSPKILMARIDAILRRTGGGDGEDILKDEEIEINKTAHTVTVGGREVDLSFKEFELLAFLMENKGVALSREKILNHVWNYDYFGDARTIDTHVKKLRSKIGENGNRIKTIWGVGYKFD